MTAGAATHAYTHTSRGALAFAGTLLLAACSATPVQTAVPAPQGSMLARAGRDGFHSYRTPALGVSPDGTLIAAYSAQVHSGQDLPNDIDIAVRTSGDGGRHWSPQRIVVRPPRGAGASDTSLLVDRRTGRVFLFYNYGPPGIGFWNSHAGDDPATTLHPRYLWSDDNGRTWHGPRDLLGAIKQRDWRGLFTASGHGVQLENGPWRGRLLQPLVHMDAGGHIHASNIYSDDDGRTWHAGADIGRDTDESRAVQLANGQIMQNMRSDAPKVHARMLATSRDGGVHFDAPRADPQLPDPHVNADVIRVDPDAPPNAPDAHALLFSNPDDPRQRRNLTLRLSCDDGAHWSAGRVLDAGPAMYSALTRLPDGTFGILWEDGRGDLLYARFALAWVGRCPR